MTKHEEAELAQKKVESERLAIDLEDKKRRLEELQHKIGQFQHRYFLEVAQKQIELSRLNAQLADLIAKKMLYSPDLRLKKSGIEMPTEGYSESYVGFNKGARVELNNVQDTKDVKRVYRRIASIIHPDKASESKSRRLRTKLMVELNEAYAQKDTAKMQRIIDEWYESPEAVVGAGQVAELLRMKRTIELIKKRISETEVEISKILTSDIYQMMVKAYDAERSGRDIVAEMSMGINAQIQDTKNKIFLRMYG